MNKKILLLLLLSIFVFSLAACSKDKDNAALKDDSKVLATVDRKNITQQQVDNLRKTSYFSEKEMVEKLINDELLLKKSKELNISVSENEAKDEVQKTREQLEKPDNKDYKAMVDAIIKESGLTEEEYWNSLAVQAYKKSMLIGKTRQKLGVDVDKTLQQLREKAKITYYN